MVVLHELTPRALGDNNVLLKKCTEFVVPDVFLNALHSMQGLIDLGSNMTELRSGSGPDTPELMNSWFWIPDYHAGSLYAHYGIDGYAAITFTGALEDKHFYNAEAYWKDTSGILHAYTMSAERNENTAPIMAFYQGTKDVVLLTAVGRESSWFDVKSVTANLVDTLGGVKWGNQSVPYGYTFSKKCEDIRMSWLMATTQSAGL